jgi:hypothetical protein
LIGAADSLNRFAPQVTSWEVQASIALHYSPVAALLKPLREVASIGAEIRTYVERLEGLKDLINRYDFLESQIIPLSIREERRDLFERIKKMKGTITEKAREKKELSDLVETYQTNQAHISLFSKKLEEERAKLPETCPYCGGSLKGVKHGAN